MITTSNPRTGAITPTDLEQTTSEQVVHITSLARKAAPQLSQWGRGNRAALLEAISQAIEAHRAELVAVADEETGLGETRLNTELSRSRFQFSLFADAIQEGSYLEAAIDHAAQTVLGPQPDVRRLLVPMGPVAVFGSSNFPFAFSVLGGDVASAIAAGCPVIAKAHSSHPLTSRLSYNVLTEAAQEAGAPEGTVGIVYGQAAGTLLVSDPTIAAVGFTGSLNAAKALQAAISDRKDPVPFFGELSSVNPLVITEAAASQRSRQIAQDLFGSYTGSGGQLCTKPGIAFVPNTAGGDALVEDLAALTGVAGSAVLLNGRIRDAFDSISESLLKAGTDLLARGAEVGAAGFTAQPTLLVAAAADVNAEIAEECFGPLMVVVRYTTSSELTRALGEIPKSLTITVISEDSDNDWLGDLSSQLQDSAGRLVFNGYPTGVRVSWAQTHGGPWPSTNTQHTSVGVTSIRRWLRPVSWQNAPQSLLPPELRDGPIEVPRREDGALKLPGAR